MDANMHTISASSTSEWTSVQCIYSK